MGKVMPWKILFAIFMLALFLRLFAVFSQDESKTLPFSDAKQYDNIAVNIVSGHGFSKIVGGPYVPTTIRTPGYPLFLAGIYAVFGHSYIAVKIIQAVLGAVLCILIFFIANTIYDDKRVGLISSVLTAIYKPFILGFHYYGGPALLLTEYLHMFVVASAVLTLLLFIKKENKAFGILGGFLAGLAILIRAEFIIYLILLFFYLLCMHRLSVKKLVRKYLVLYLFIASQSA